MSTIIELQEAPTHTEGGWRESLQTALRLLLVMTVLTGVLYPLLVLGVSQALMPSRANGSVVSINGIARGSSLIGQSFFAQPGYFWGRPSAAGADGGYDGSLSSGSNLGPTSSALIERVDELTAFYQEQHPEHASEAVPVDLVTASGSGLDPHISPAAADYQLERVARERGISVDTVRDMVEQHTEERTLGILGEPRVNVLELNMALDDVSASE